MVIDPSKANLKEKDIEDYLWLHPDILGIERWIARQYEVPSGIIDLLGVTDLYDFVVVEVKNVDIDAAALTQVSRYAHDISAVAGDISARNIYDVVGPDVHKIVVGKGIDTKTMLEAEALDRSVKTFDIRLSLDIHTVVWKDEYLSNRDDRWRAMQDDERISSVIHSFIDMRFGKAKDTDDSTVVQGEV